MNNDKQRFPDRGLTTQQARCFAKFRTQSLLACAWSLSKPTVDVCRKPIPDPGVFVDARNVLYDGTQFSFGSRFQFNPVIRIVRT